MWEYVAEARQCNGLRIKQQAGDSETSWYFDPPWALEGSVTNCLSANIPRSLGIQHTGHLLPHVNLYLIYTLQIYLFILHFTCMGIKLYSINRKQIHGWLLWSFCLLYIVSLNAVLCCVFILQHGVPCSQVARCWMQWRRAVRAVK